MPRRYTEVRSICLISGMLALTASVVTAQTRVVSPVVELRDTVATATGTASGSQFSASRIRLNVDGQISELSVDNLSQLLSGRFAGVQVLTPGATGMASRIRIRGQSSITLDNEPLIIVDGVRLFESQRVSDRAILSRVDDINVNEIASIDLLSGPAGTAQYGSGGAHGVISITTKRGAVGKTRVNAYAEGGVITDPNDYPEQWALWGKVTGRTGSNLCTLTNVAQGTCVVDSLRSGSVMKGVASPVDRGYRNRFGAQVSGGVTKFQYFVAAEREDETGIFKMPSVDVNRLEAARGADVPDFQIRPSVRAHNNLRINLSAQPFTFLTLDLSSGYINGNARFVTSENSSDGIWANAIGGPWNPTGTGPTGTPPNAYLFSSAGEVMSQTNRQNIDRYLNTIAATVRPYSWLNARASLARDDATQNDSRTVRPNEGSANFPISEGSLSTADLVTANTLLTGSATASFKPRSWFTTATTIGVQRLQSSLSEKARSGQVIGGAVFNTSTSFVERKTMSYLLQEELSFGEKFFLSGGLRNETPEFFGTKLDGVNYHNVGASLALSNFSALQSRKWLNMLRLRTAYGTSGQEVDLRGLTSSFTFFLPIGAPAPDPIRPEITAELEGGFDLAVRDNRTQLSFTYYNKRTRDALVRELIAPGIGTPPAAMKNGARIQNRGFELTLRQQLIKRSAFGADIGLTASNNRNKVLEFPAGAPPIFDGNRTTLQTRPDYPVLGFWARSYTYGDANNDGIIAPSEVTLSESSTYYGSSFPVSELALTPAIQLLNGKLRLSAQVDSKWGFRKFNNTLRAQCQLNACRAVTDKTTPLDEQAAAVASLKGGVNPGYFEDGAFTRLREASVAYTLPSRWSNAIHASEWTFALTGRNLAVWTKYTGVDPEATESNTDAFSDEFFATPLMSYWTAKMRIRF